MIADKKIPALRFPEFEGEWIASTISSIATKVTDGTHDTPNKTTEGIPFITAIHIRDGIINFDECYYVSQKDHNEIYKRCNPEKGDLLMVNIGAGSATCAIVDVDYEFSLKNVALIKPDRNKIDPYFLAQYQRPKTSKLLNQLSSGGAQPFLSLNAIGKLKVEYPLIQEQQKIASFLTAVDDKIQQLTKKKALLEQYKKGVMQQIFSQQIRFKDDNENDYPDWEEKKLGSYVDIKSGGSPANYHLKEKGLFPFLKVEELNNSNKYQVHNSREYTDVNTNVIEPFSIIFPKRGAAIMTNKVRVNKVAVQIDSNLMAIKPIDSRLNPEYLYYIITHTQLFKIADTSTIPQINNKHIIPYKFKLPSTPEQEKVANFLITIDNKINVANKQLEKAQEYKKGLLQQMFV